MKIRQVSEKIIINNYDKLEDIMEKKLSHNESNLYYKDGLVYKIYKKIYRSERYKYMYLLNDISFINACNIIDELFQGDKFIGVTTKYLENFKTLSELLNYLDLYKIKIIFNYIINFFNQSFQKNFIYWDLHLNNMGFSNNKFYIMDIDSMKYNPTTDEKKYATISLLYLFYELCFKEHIRNNYENYKDIIFYLCNDEKFLDYSLSINDLKRIINNTSENFIEENKHILKKFRKYNL